MARNKYPEVTEERILEAAQRLFLEKGYDNTTIQDIVDQLGGLTKGAVYHHFKSKEEILDKVSDRMFFQNNPFEAVKQRGDLNGLEKLREAVRLNQADASPHQPDPAILALEHKPPAAGGDDRFQPARPHPLLFGAAGGGQPGRLLAHRVSPGDRRAAAGAHQPVADAQPIPRHQGEDEAEVHLPGGDAGAHGRAPV